MAQIFIENRIYKNIEKCKTYEAVQSTVLEGVSKFREQLRRDVTAEDVEMLLGLRIKRFHSSTSNRTGARSTRWRSSWWRPKSISRG